MHPQRLALAVVALVGLAACSDDGREMKPPGEDQLESVATTTTVDPAASTVLPGLSDGTGDEAAATDGIGFALTGPWPDGGPIDPGATCDGSDLSPSLRWFGVPVGTATVALVVTDLDATGPDGDPFVHWALANVPPDVTALEEGVVPAGAIEGVNDFGTEGWRGPCPPPGGSHRYRFELHALDQQLDLASGTPAADLLVAISAASLATTDYVGVYPSA